MKRIDENRAANSVTLCASCSQAEVYTKHPFVERLLRNVYVLYIKRLINDKASQSLIIPICVPLPAIDRG